MTADGPLNSQASGCGSRVVSAIDTLVGVTEEDAVLDGISATKIAVITSSNVKKRSLTASYLGAKNLRSRPGPKVFEAFHQDR